MAPPRLLLLLPLLPLWRAWTLPDLHPEPCRALRRHGVATVANAFDVQGLGALLKAFRGLSEQQLEAYRFGQLRAKRRAVHLPDLEAFRVPLLGVAWQGEVGLRMGLTCFVGPFYTSLSSFKVYNMIYIQIYRRGSPLLFLSWPK